MYTFYSEDELRDEIAKADKFAQFLRDEIKKIPHTKEKKAYLELSTMSGFMTQVADWAETQRTSAAEKRRALKLKKYYSDIQEKVAETAKRLAKKEDDKKKQK